MRMVPRVGCSIPLHAQMRENYFGTLEDLHALDKKSIAPQDAQKVRPARSQHLKQGEGMVKVE